MARESSMKRKRAVGNFFSYLLLIIIVVIWLFPFVGLVLGSFRSFDASVEYGGIVDYVIPKHFSLDNYKFVLSDETNYKRWYLNTVVIAAFVSVLQTIIVLCVSYALSRMRFAGRTLLMRFWLILGMFPGFLTMICLYFLLKRWDLPRQVLSPDLSLCR